MACCPLGEFCRGFIDGGGGDVQPLGLVEAPFVSGAAVVVTVEMRFYLRLLMVGGMIGLGVRL